MCYFVYMVKLLKYGLTFFPRVIAQKVLTCFSNPCLAQPAWIDNHCNTTILYTPRPPIEQLLDKNGSINFKI